MSLSPRKRPRVSLDANKTKRPLFITPSELCARITSTPCTHSKRAITRLIENVSKSGIQSIAWPLAELLATLAQVEAVCSAQEPKQPDRSPPRKRVRFNAVDDSSIDVPNSTDIQSIQPMKTLLGVLDQLVSVSNTVRNELKCDSMLRAQLVQFVHTLGNIQGDDDHEHECKLTAQFLQKELTLLSKSPLSSRLVNRRREVQSSLLRHELKRLLNDRAALNAESGNLLHNFEDIAAIFNHALGFLNGLRSDEPLSLRIPSIDLCEELMSEQEGRSLCEIFNPILDELKETRGAEIFLRPVKETWPSLADHYRSVISHPMDISSVEENLKQEKYLTAEDVLRDISLIFENARTYNGDDSYYGDRANACERRFEAIALQHLNRHQNIEHRLCDVLSSISAIRFCYDLFQLPAIDQSVSENQWVEVEALAAQTAVQSRYYLLSDMNAFITNVGNSLPMAEDCEVRTRQYLASLCASNRRKRRTMANSNTAAHSEEICSFPNPVQVQDD